jgi:hypothetical protein
MSNDIRQPEHIRHQFNRFIRSVSDGYRSEIALKQFALEKLGYAKLDYDESGNVVSN